MEAGSEAGRVSKPSLGLPTAKPQPQLRRSAPGDAQPPATATLTRGARRAAKKGLFPHVFNPYWAFFKSAQKEKGRGKAGASPVGIDSCQSRVTPAKPLSLEDFRDNNLNFSCAPVAGSCGGTRVPPDHDTAARSGWKTRETLNVMETPGRGHQGHGKGEGRGGWRCWRVGGPLPSAPAPRGGHFEVQSHAPTHTRPLWVSHPGRASQLNLGPACSAGALPGGRRCRMLPPGPAVPRGPRQGRAIAGHLPPSPPSAAKSTGALRDAGEN